MTDAPLNISGPMVRRLRVERGWSQPKLAAECQMAGVKSSRDIIARIEAGIKPVRDVELATLAAVLGVKPTDLIESEFKAAVQRVHLAKEIRRETLKEVGPASQRGR